MIELPEKYRLLKFINKPSAIINSDGLVLFTNSLFAEIFGNEFTEANIIELVKKKVN